MDAPFGPGFLWGAATSAHQTEGGNLHSDWWAWEQSGHPFIAEPSGRAADSYHRWPEDLDLLAAAGFTDYRFSVEWARIEPDPGVVDDREVDRYRAMVEGCHQRGLRPMVTLHHFTTPRWFAERGGWRDVDAAQRFLRFLELIAPVLDDGVRHACTINEPNMVATIPRLLQRGHLGGPGLPEPDPQLTEALIGVHHRARQQLHDRHPGLRVGWSVACHSTQAERGAEFARDAYAQPREGVFIRAAEGDDWIGVQAYTRTIIGQRDGRPVVRPTPPDASTTLKGWEYYPEALGVAVGQVSTLLPTVPIIVTENGIATADDRQRIAYTRDALRALARAIAGGADVRGYFHWSLLDNYEWGSFRPTFGLIAIDADTCDRVPRPSLAWLGRQAPDRG